MRRKHYAGNADVERAKQNSRRAANPERFRERDKIYYEANREASIDKSKAYYQRNRAARRKFNRDRYAADPEKYRAISRVWRLNNLEKAKASYKRWADANKDVINHHTRLRHARIKNATIHKFTVEQLDQRMSMFGYRCIYCDGPFEEVDHYKPLTRGGAHALANLRPSCKRCNCRKRNKPPLEFLEWLKDNA